MTTAPTALLLTGDGAIAEINLPTTNQLTVMQAVLRCDRVDVVALTTRMDMWIDDEGIYNHEINVPATLLARRYGFCYQAYHGPVLLTGGADAEGDTLPLTPERLRALLTALQDTTE
jgi:hypothetical protein